MWFNRNRAAAASLTLLVMIGAVGCTPAMHAARDTFVTAFSAPPPLEVKREDVFARPYYQLRADSPHGSAILVLGRVTDGHEYWADTAGNVLVIAHGLVRRTTGFPQTLESTRFVSPDPFAHGLQHLAAGATSERVIDFAPGYRFGIHARSHFEPRGLERVEILGETVELKRIDEHLTAPAADYFAVNRYWVNPADGTILRSEQQVTPDLRLTLTALRPYRPEGAQ